MMMTTTTGNQSFGENENTVKRRTRKYNAAWLLPRSKTSIDVMKAEKKRLLSQSAPPENKRKRTDDDDDRVQKSLEPSFRDKTPGGADTLRKNTPGADRRSSSLENKKRRTDSYEKDEIDDINQTNVKKATVSNEAIQMPSFFHDANKHVIVFYKRLMVSSFFTSDDFFFNWFHNLSTLPDVDAHVMGLTKFDVDFISAASVALVSPLTLSIYRFDGIGIFSSIRDDIETSVYRASEIVSSPFSTTGSTPFLSSERSRSMSRETTSDETEECEPSDEVKKRTLCERAHSFDRSTINKSKLLDTIRILEKCKNDHRYAIVPRASLSKTCKICIDRVHKITTNVSENKDVGDSLDIKSNTSKDKVTHFYEKLPLHPNYASKIRQTIVKRIFILFSSSVAALVMNNDERRNDREYSTPSDRTPMDRESIALLAIYRCCGIITSFLSVVLDPSLLNFFKELPFKMKEFFDDMYIKLGHYTDNQVISEFSRLFEETMNDAAWKGQEKLVLKCFI